MEEIVVKMGTVKVMVQVNKRVIVEYMMVMVVVVVMAMEMVVVVVKMTVKVAKMMNVKMVNVKVMMAAMRGKTVVIAMAFLTWAMVLTKAGMVAMLVV